MSKVYVILIYICIIGAFKDYAASSPVESLRDTKAMYKSGEIQDLESPITMDQIKKKLKQSGIFDYQDPNLTEMERKEVSNLFDAVEIMMTSRNRQPQNVQNMFSSLRTVERAVQKKLKEGQLSESLAAKFHWDKLTTRVTRDDESKQIMYSNSK